MMNSFPIRLTIQVPLLLIAAGILFRQSPHAAQQGAQKTPASQQAPAQSGAGSANAAGMPASAGPEQILLMRPTSSMEIQAEPSKVWKRLVSSDGLAAFQMETIPRGKILEKVGDHAQATVSGDRGNIVVTHSESGKQWRAAFEPDKGHYICSVRFELKPQGKGTLLTYGDWYSDEKPAQAEATLKETRKSMGEGLARFKSLVEKASAGQ